MVEGYPDSLGGWGAPAIFKEAGRLLAKYFRLLHPFILAFFLPVALIQLLEVLGIAWGFSRHPHHHPHPHPHPHPHGHHHHHHPHHPFGGFFRAFYVHGHAHEGAYPGAYGSKEDVFSPAPSPHPHPPHHPHPPIYFLLIGAAIAILVWLLTSLAVAAIAKAIAYIYSSEPSEDPSVTKSIFKSLPQALYRIFITTLWILLFTAVVVFVISLPFHLLAFIFKRKLNFHIIAILNKVFVDIALLVLGFVFLLALEVAVLEPDNYGLAALKKSWKLVKSKLVAALIFFLVYIIFAGLLSKLAKLAIFLPVTGKLPFWTVYIFAVVWALLYLLFTVYFLVAAIVLYFSTKLKSDADEQYLPVNTSDDNPYTPLVTPSEN